MKRPVKLSPEVEKYHNSRTPETRKGLGEVYTQFGDDFERTGYPVVSEPGCRSAHVNHYGVEYEGRPLRVIARLIEGFVGIVRVGTHNDSSDGMVSVYKDERGKNNHRKHRR